MYVATTEPDTVFDVLVIGGGINGAGIARDAAGRGLSTCLVEQHDLASHTSSASTKLIHGGLRYLEHGELRLVRESLAERERLLAIAPHIIKPLRFILPYVDGLRPRWLLRLGLFVYDHAGGRERLAASSSTTLKGNVLGEPLRPELTDGFEYSDCWVEDSRLVVLNAMDAAERGATIHTRTRVTHAESANGIWTVRCQQASGEQITLRANALVNATGAWVNELLGLLAIQPRQRLRLVKGSHLVLRRQFAGEHAYLLQSPDRRVIFAIPFEQEYTLLGTTDVPFNGDPGAVSIDSGERDYLLACANRFFRRSVTAADVVTTYSGVRPLFDDGTSETAQQVSRDYHLEFQRSSGGAPVLTVYGGKITTYRRLAEAALSLLRPDAEDGSWTADEALPGGDFPDADLERFTAHALQRWSSLSPPLVRRLARLYGTRMAQILGNATRMDEPAICEGIDVTLAEVRYLVEKEWARSADDILWRRTRLGLAASPLAVDQLQDAVAQLLG